MEDQEQVWAKAELLRTRSRDRDLWITTRGTSMGRTLAAGTEVLVKPLKRPRLGEVWVFCDYTGDIVAHRYLRPSGQRFVFRGDATAASDAPVDRRQLIGKVVLTRDGADEARPSRLPWIGLVVRAALAKMRSA